MRDGAWVARTLLNAVGNEHHHIPYIAGGRWKILFAGQQGLGDWCGAFRIQGFQFLLHAREIVIGKRHLQFGVMAVMQFAFRLMTIYAQGNLQVRIAFQRIHHFGKQPVGDMYLFVALPFPPHAVGGVKNKKDACQCGKIFVGDGLGIP